MSSPSKSPQASISTLPATNTNFDLSNPVNWPASNDQDHRRSSPPIEPASSLAVHDEGISSRSSHSEPLRVATRSELSAPFDNATSITAIDAESRLETDQRIEGLLAELKRIAQVHLRAYHRRAAAKEQGKIMRHTQQDMFKVIRSLIDSIKRAMTSSNAASSVSPLEQGFGDWEDSLVEIEELQTREEHAGRMWDQEIEELVRLEHEMYELENKLYSKHPSAQSSVGGHASALPEVDFDEDFDDEPAPSTEVVSRFTSEEPALTDLEHEAADAIDQHGSSPKGGVLDGSALVTRSYSDSHLPKMRSSVQPRQIAGDQALDNQLSGSQFRDTEIDRAKAVAKEESLAQVQAQVNQLPEEELHNFTRWLVYGTAWTPLSTLNRNSIRSALTNIKFFRAWVWYQLEAVGLPIDTPRGPADREKTFSSLVQYIKQWFSDPYAQVDVMHDHVGVEVDDFVEVIPAAKAIPSAVNNERSTSACLPNPSGDTTTSIRTGNSNRRTRAPSTSVQPNEDHALSTSPEPQQMPMETTDEPVVRAVPSTVTCRFHSAPPLRRRSSVDLSQPPRTSADDAGHGNSIPSHQQPRRSSLPQDLGDLPASVSPAPWT